MMTTHITDHIYPRKQKNSSELKFPLILALIFSLDDYKLISVQRLLLYISNCILRIKKINIKNLEENHFFLTLISISEVYESVCTVSAIIYRFPDWFDASERRDLRFMISSLPLRSTLGTRLTSGQLLQSFSYSSSGLDSSGNSSLLEQDFLISASFSMISDILAVPSSVKLLGPISPLITRFISS